jgi:hypothetical protein
LGLGIVAFVAWFLVAHLIGNEGGIDPSRQPFRMSPVEIALAVTMFIAVVSMLLGWRWELLAGILIVVNMTLFLLIDGMASHSWPRGWIIWSFTVPGILYLLASGFEACRARHLRVKT